MEVLVTCLCWWYICDISGPSGLVASSANFFFLGGRGCFSFSFRHGSMECLKVEDLMLPFFLREQGCAQMPGFVYANKLHGLLFEFSHFRGGSTCVHALA